MKQRICYLDMDGVLVDFVNGALYEHAVTIPEGDVQWDFNKQLNIPDPEFWGPFGRSFWANLDWTREGALLLNALEYEFGTDHIVILSSPCGTPGCAEGKLDWIKKHIPQYKRQFLFGPAKHLCASPSHILIDDSDSNVEKFRMYGGHACLVPRSWNKNRHLTSKNIFRVADFMDTVRREIALCTTG